jgi:hypothetical protein
VLGECSGDCYKEDPGCELPLHADSALHGFDRRRPYSKRHIQRVDEEYALRYGQHKPWHRTILGVVTECESD